MWRLYIIGLCALLVACASPPTPEPEPTDLPPLTMVPIEGGGAGIQTVDQTLTDGTVTVPRVVSTGPGWLVIYNDDNGQPGDVIGHRRLLPGETTDAAVEIDTDALTETLHAIVHVDLPEVRTFDYPDGDPRLTDSDGRTVAGTFTVTR